MEAMMLIVGLTVGCILGGIMGFTVGDQNLYRQYPCTESAIINGHPTCVKYERKEEEK